MKKILFGGLAAFCSVLLILLILSPKPPLFAQINPPQPGGGSSSAGLRSLIVDSNGVIFGPASGTNFFANNSSALNNAVATFAGYVLRTNRYEGTSYQSFYMSTNSGDPYSMNLVIGQLSFTNAARGDATGSAFENTILGSGNGVRMGSNSARNLIVGQFNAMATTQDLAGIMLLGGDIFETTTNISTAIAFGHDVFSTAGRVADSVVLGKQVGGAMLDARRLIWIGQQMGVSTYAADGNNTVNSSRGILLGYGAGVKSGVTNYVGFGDQAWGGLDNSVFFGGYYNSIPDLFLGGGTEAAGQSTATFSASGGFASDSHGWNTRLAGGFSKGAKPGGSASLAVTPADNSGSTRNSPISGVTVSTHTNQIHLTVTGVLSGLTGSYTWSSGAYRNTDNSQIITNVGGYWAEKAIGGSADFTNSVLIGSAWSDANELGGTLTTTFHSNNVVQLSGITAGIVLTNGDGLRFRLGIGATTNLTFTFIP